MDSPDFNLASSKIAIVGLGLMGGSLALALKGRCAALYGIDTQRPTLELALSQNIVDSADEDPAKLLSKADLVIFATPVPAILALLEELPNLTPNPCIVFDLGSTKRLIVEAMSRLPERFDPIGGHPICGKEKLSLTNAERTLYYAAPFLLTPLERTTPRAFSAVNQIMEAIGAKPTVLDASEHDRILAATSHLPFLLSSALSLTVPLHVAPFIGPGFRSVSRLASTPASMMLGVLQTNRENVLESIRHFQHSLDEIENVLQDEDLTSLEEILNHSKSAYDLLITDTNY
jgi:prephenate dehydrogenase